MTHTAEVPAPLRRFAGVWYPLFGTTLIWLTHLIAVGAMAPPSCRDDRWVIAMHLVTAVTAVSTVGGALLAWRGMRDNRADTTSSSDPGRRRFLGQLGVAVALTNTLLIVSEGLMVFALGAHRCA